MSDAPDPRIWPQHDKLDENDPEWGLRHVYSDRAGGDYSVSLQTGIHLQGVDDDTRRRLTTLLVDQRGIGDPWPEVTPELIEQAKNSRPLSVQDRATRLLRYLVDHSPTVGSGLNLYNNQELIQGAFAHSESVQPNELDFLHKYLLELKFLEGRDAAFFIVSPRDGLNNSPERVSGCDHGATGERGAPCSSVRSAASSRAQEGQDEAADVPRAHGQACPLG